MLQQQQQQLGNGQTLPKQSKITHKSFFSDFQDLL